MRSTIMLSVLTAGLLSVAGAASSQVTQTTVVVTWVASGDDGVSGIADQYDLRYSTSPVTASNFGSARRWASTPTPLAAGTVQSVTVTGLLPGTSYYFAIKTADERPNWSLISNVISRTTLPADAIRPAAVTTLVAKAVAETTVTLQWSAVGDDSLQGVAALYDLRYATAPVTEANWATATRANGEPTPAAAGTSQTFQVAGLVRQMTYYLALKVIDEAGNASGLSTVVQANTPDLTPPAAVQDLETVP